jgi:hypothetical protein
MSPHLRTHDYRSLLVNFHCDAKASAGQRFFAPFSIEKMSPSPLNAGLLKLWWILMILCIGFGVVLPGTVLKVGRLAFLMFLGHWDIALLIVETIFTATIYRGYCVTQFLPLISVIVFSVLSLSPLALLSCS